MPLKIPKNLPAFSILTKENIFVMNELCANNLIVFIKIHHMTLS